MSEQVSQSEKGLGLLRQLAGFAGRVLGLDMERRASRAPANYSDEGVLYISDDEEVDDEPLREYPDHVWDELSRSLAEREAHMRAHAQELATESPEAAALRQERIEADIADYLRTRSLWRTHD